MPVLKDLIVDMDAVHWKKIQRVVPWLLPEGSLPEREYVVPAESMIDITQSMACIQCGACVSACLSMEVDPEFVGPAALAKAYRFVGDPRDSQTEERLRDLAEDPHGIYDCTHCFACIEVCPKDVAPMSQIMRLRRRASGDYGIKDSNNGYGHEKAFVDIVEGTARSTSPSSCPAPTPTARWSRARSDRTPSSSSPRTPHGAERPALREGLAGQGDPQEAARPGPGAADLPRGRVPWRADRAQPYIVGDEAEGVQGPDAGADEPAMGDAADVATGPEAGGEQGAAVQ